MNNKTPEVFLLSWTKDPIKVIYSEIQMYDCKEPVTDFDKVNIDDAKKAIKEALKSHLKGCLEKISVVFQLKNIPRAMTHQIVRTRIGASYAQQSMRFTKFEDFEYYIPPEIKNETAISVYKDSMKNSFDSYTKLIELGVSTQDSRGVLPIATSTHIMISYTLKTLVDLAEKRLCMQAQNFWQVVVSKMKKEISDKIDPFLASLMAPKCIKEGKCPYQSDLDRDCPIAKFYKLQEAKKKYVHPETDTSWDEKLQIAKIITGMPKFDVKE